MKLKTRLQVSNLRFLAASVTVATLLTLTAQAANDFWRPLNAGGAWDTTTRNWSTTGNNAVTAATWVFRRDFK